MQDSKPNNQVSDKASEVKDKEDNTVHIDDLLPEGTPNLIDKIEIVESIEVKKKVAKIQVESTSQREKSKAQRSPWLSGFFYLFSAIAVGILLLVAAMIIPPVFLPIVVVGVLLVVSIIGALQLRQDEQLKQRNFLILMLLVFRGIPFLRKSEKD